MNNCEFTALVNSQTDTLKAHAMRFTHDLEDANDLIQDTLIKALRFASSFEPGSNLSGWLYVIMKNTFINNYKKSANRSSLISIEEELTSDQLKHSAAKNDAEGKFLMEEILSALGTLPEVYRIPFIRYFEGFKYHEIAA